MCFFVRENGRESRRRRETWRDIMKKRIQKIPSIEVALHNVG
jgi:hypothetical protein